MPTLPQRRNVQVMLKPSLTAKLDELRRLDPDATDASLLREAFRIAFPLMRAGNTTVPDIEEVAEESASRMQEESPAMVPFELVGEVAAGKPIDCEIETEIVPLPKDHYERYKAKGGKLVRVRGDSMKEAGIKDGELIIFRPQKTAENGQIVVADIKGDGTVLKKFHAEKGMVVLTSMNPDYAPILKKASEVVIHGLYLDSVRFA